MNTPASPYRDFITDRLDELAQLAQDAHTELQQLFAAEGHLLGHLAAADWTWGYPMTDPNIHKPAEKGTYQLRAFSTIITRAGTRTPLKTPPHAKILNQFSPAAITALTTVLAAAAAAATDTELQAIAAIWKDHPNHPDRKTIGQ